MQYSIGEFSALTGLSIHTLRYYEKENLILPKRGRNNRRAYSEEDVTWIHFIKRLKDTGMPIKEIRRYAQLRAKGNTTLSERMELLQRHHKILSDELIQSQEHLHKLDEKIHFYQRAITHVCDS